MYVKDFVINNSWQGKKLESISEGFPYTFISIFPLALVIKSVDLVDILVLVISSQDCYSGWISYFQSKCQRDCFDWIVTSIDVVPHEEKIEIGWHSSNLKQLDEIIDLAVKITTHRYWCFNMYKILFLI